MRAAWEGEPFRSAELAPAAGAEGVPAPPAGSEAGRSGIAPGRPARVGPNAGPGAAGRAGTLTPAGGGRTCSRVANAGVTPSVAVVGATGTRPTTGRARARSAAGSGRATPAIDAEVAMEAAGATLAAAAFTYRFTVTLLTVVTFEMLVTFCT